MYVITSVVFQVVVFPHEGKLVTVDQLNFTRKGRMDSNESTVPLVYQVKPSTESLGASTFDLPALINYIGSTSVGKSIAMVVDRTDPWVLSSPHEPEVPLLAMEVAYQAITQTTVDPICLSLRGTGRSLFSCLGRKIFAFYRLFRYSFTF